MNHKLDNLLQAAISDKYYHAIIDGCDIRLDLSTYKRNQVLYINDSRSHNCDRLRMISIIREWKDGKRKLIHDTEDDYYFLGMA